MQTKMASNNSTSTTFPSWEYGVLLTILGQFTSTAGLLFLKRSSTEEAAKVWYTRKYFWLGVLCVFSNGAGIDIVALALAPLSLIAPFAALSIVFSNILAATGTFVRKEIVTGTALVANLAIIFGIVVVCYYGPHDTTSHTMAEMAQDSTRKPFLLFALPSLSIIFLYIIATRVFGWYQKNTASVEEDRTGTTVSKNYGTMSTTMAVSAADSLPSSFPSSPPPPPPPGSHLTSPSESSLHSAPIIKCVWCALASASCAALSQVCLKCVSEALSVTLSTGPTQLKYWQTYIPVVGILIFAPSNVKLLDEALEAAPATYGIPVYQSLLVICTIIGGGTFFDEFSALKSANQTYAFCFGIVLVIVGLGMLSFSHTDDAADSLDNDQYTDDAADSLDNDQYARLLSSEIDTKDDVEEKEDEDEEDNEKRVTPARRRIRRPPSVSVVTAAASLMNRGETSRVILTSPKMSGRFRGKRRRHSQSNHF
jgi:hypothetical protein